MWHLCQRLQQDLPSVMKPDLTFGCILAYRGKIINNWFQRHMKVGEVLPYGYIPIQTRSWMAVPGNHWIFYRNADGGLAPQREICAICTGELSTMNSGREDTRMTPVIRTCGHVFHNSCLQTHASALCYVCGKNAELVTREYWGGWIRQYCKIQECNR